MCSLDNEKPLAYAIYLELNLRITNNSQIGIPSTPFDKKLRTKLKTLNYFTNNLMLLNFKNDLDSMFYEERRKKGVDFM